MIDRKIRKTLRASVLTLTDQALAYVREEAAREVKRRRLEVRARRRHARVVVARDKAPQQGWAPALQPNAV